MVGRFTFQKEKKKYYRLICLEIILPWMVIDEGPPLPLAFRAVDFHQGEILCLTAGR